MGILLSRARPSRPNSESGTSKRLTYPRRQLRARRVEWLLREPRSSPRVLRPRSAYGLRAVVSIPRKRCYIDRATRRAFSENEPSIQGSSREPAGRVHSIARRSRVVHSLCTDYSVDRGSVRRDASSRINPPMTSYALGTSSASGAPAIPPREPQHPPSLFFPRRARGRVSTRAPERGPARVGRARTRAESAVGHHEPADDPAREIRKPETRAAGMMRRDPDAAAGKRPRTSHRRSRLGRSIGARGERARRDAGDGRRERRARASPRPATRATRRRGRGRGARARARARARRALPERRAAWPRPRRVRRGAPAGGRSHDSPTTAGQRTLLVPGWEGSEVTLDTDFFGGDAERSSLVARRSSPLAASTPTRVPARLSLRAKSEDPPPTARARPGHPPNTRRAPLM